MNITNQELVAIIGEQAVKIKILESQIYQMSQKENENTEVAKTDK